VNQKVTSPAPPAVLGREEKEFGTAVGAGAGEIPPKWGLNVHRAHHASLAITFRAG